MRFGYARVSTAEQELDSQVDALQNAQCDEILMDKISGSTAIRPQLVRLLDKLRPGDAVVVCRLDRLGRSLKHLVELVEQFKAREVTLISLAEQIDTSTANGQLQLHLFAALAEFERNLISERTKSGLAAARARGRNGGRPRVMSDKQVRLAKAMLQDPMVSKQDVAAQLGVSVSTLYRNLR